MSNLVKILITNTITIPSYFNAGHHLPIFQVGEYIRRKNSNYDVVCRDVGVLNYTWKDYSNLIYTGKYSIIIIMIDFDCVDDLERMLFYIKNLSGKSKIVLFGRMCKQIPEFFKRYPVDAIVTNGDYECSVDSVIKYINGDLEQPKGCLYRYDEKWTISEEGDYLPPEQWGQPDLNEIPYDKYSNLYINDTNKFCGIPNKKELVINVSRGCPIGCEYCDVAKMQGHKDRRMTPMALYEYIINNFEKYSFDYVSMFSAIFTLNKKWIEEFSRLMLKSKIPWKCVSTIEHLSPEIIQLLGKANCIRISIGVETISTNYNNALPQIKNNTYDKIKEIVEACKACEIEVNCFVMIGIPGVSARESIKTIQLLEDLDVRIRPTIYTQYDEMKYENTISGLSKYNRQILNPDKFSLNEQDKIYQIVHGRRLKNTEIEKRFEKFNMY